ncbi:MAG: hypothetical protein RLY20_3196 [Verrucomicrobiota bacterium]|jgi:DNA-binding NarL/FixJ family response regulator
MKKLRFIIADDHSMVRQGVKSVIAAQRSWDLCGEADNGRSAVELARRLKPDIAVLDVTMPELNGLDALRLIKVESPKTKVLILTMHDSEALAEEVLEAGAGGILLKSDAAELLPKAVAALVSGRSFLTPKINGAAPVTEPDETEAGPQKFHFRLSPRERQIVQMLAEGRTNKQTADALGITTNTVETHRKNILNKIQAHSSADLVRYAIRQKLIPP